MGKKVTDIIEGINGIKNSQKTIDKLIKLGTMGMDGKKPKNNWTLEHLDVQEDCSIGIVKIKKTEYGACENHVHPHSKEFLIVISGRMMFNLDGQDVRELNIGDCATVNPGRLHHVRPLSDNTTLLYVCVPEDEGMTRLARMFDK